eukprot:m.950138 g.950138  ORF g.950138 m.950138 type:complete len:169 (+) comp328266_c0_seq1:2-508(+)
MAEDLYFFYDFFAKSQALTKIPYFKLDEVLLQYRHTAGSVCSLVPKATIREIRAHYFEAQVLVGKPWTDGFGVWGAGKNGRQFYQQLSDRAQALVKVFYDIDDSKIARDYHDHGRNHRALVRVIPVKHFSTLQPPFITCVSLDRTDGAFEENLASLRLQEGVDYFPFS